MTSEKDGRQTYAGGKSRAQAAVDDSWRNGRCAFIHRSGKRKVAGRAVVDMFNGECTWWRQEA